MDKKLMTYRRRMLLGIALILAVAAMASAVDITVTISTQLDDELTLERLARNAQSCATYQLPRTCGQVALRAAHCAAIGKEAGCVEATDRIFATNAAWLDYATTEHLQARRDARTAREKRIKTDADSACEDKNLAPGCTLGQ